MRFNSGLGLRREWIKLINKILYNSIAVRDKIAEFELNIQNIFSILNDEIQSDTVGAYYKFAMIVVKRRVKLTGASNNSGSKTSKDIIKKHKYMIMRIRWDETESELTELINNRKVRDISNGMVKA